MTPSPLPHIMIEPLVRMALARRSRPRRRFDDQRDRADRHRATTLLVARQPGVVAGLDLARLAFRLIDPAIEMRLRAQRWRRAGARRRDRHDHRPRAGHSDGGTGCVEFPVPPERHRHGDRVHGGGGPGHKAQIVCTRKTMPGLRAIEKYAVRVGGGGNHRFGLDDAVLIKDNHVAIAGGVTEALKRARSGVGHLVKIELEVDTLDQLREALDHGVDAVLLDNMEQPHSREAVAMVAGRAVTEASGRITPATAPQIAATGVDLISIGWLTHSVSILDIGLDFER